MRRLKLISTIIPKFQKYNQIREQPLLDFNSLHLSDNKMEVVVGNRQGWRSGNEDTHIVNLQVPNLYGHDIRIFGVFDGHASDAISTFCEMKYVETLISLPSFQNQQYQQALQETNLYLDEILKRSETNELLKTIGNGSGLLFHQYHNTDISNISGTTAIIVLIVNNELYCSNCGDSKSVIIQKNGNIIPLSNDHKLTYQGEMERIINAGGMIENNRVNGTLNLTRSIGNLSFKKNPNLLPIQQIITSFPEVTQYQLSQNDEFIILGCDGIWDMMSPMVIKQLIYQYASVGTNLYYITEQLTKDCIATHLNRSDCCGYDNVTLIIIHFKW